MEVRAITWADLSGYGLAVAILLSCYALTYAPATFAAWQRARRERDSRLLDAALCCYGFVAGGLLALPYEAAIYIFTT